MLGHRIIRNIGTHSKTHAAAVALKPVTEEYRTIKSLPGPARIPGYGTLWFLDKMIFSSKRQKLYLHTYDLAIKHGRMINLSFGGEDMVGIACPKVMEEVLRTQDKGNPIRKSPQPWADYIEESGAKPGLLTSQHEEWKKRRSPVSPLLLKTNSFESHASAIQTIVSEFSDSLEHRADGTGYIENMPMKLTHLTHEVITQVLFGIRLNCCTGKPDEKAERFIMSVNRIVEDSFNYKAVYSSLMKKLNTKGWKEHRAAWVTCIAEAKALTAHSLTLGEKFEKEGFLPLIYSIMDKMEENEVTTMVTELLMGGVDTTSNTLGFILYNLAKHPESQQKLREEIMNLGDRRAESKYVKNVVKETLRLYPIVPINGRTIEKEFISEHSGTIFTKDMTVLLFHYFMSRDPETFKQADQFIPERFDRENTTANSPERGMVSIPFGFGVRSCVGRRLAELEMNLAIIDIVSKYKIEPIGNIKLDPILRGVLTPGLQLPIRFIKL